MLGLSDCVRMTQMNDVRRIIIYTDGCSYPSNPGKVGSWCSITLWNGNEKVVSKTVTQGLITSNRMESLAVIETLEMILKSGVKYPIKIVTDSMYNVYGLRAGRKWSRKKKLLNKDIWERYWNLLDTYKHQEIKAEWIAGHNGDRYNERCDSICLEIAKKEYYMRL